VLPPNLPIFDRIRATAFYILSMKGPVPVIANGTKYLKMLMPDIQKSILRLYTMNQIKRMKHFSTILLATLLTIAVQLNLSGQTADISRYNVAWNSQSKNASESMPCGGGDIGLNVWVENGDVLFYLSRSGTFDENNTMLKLGRVRLKLSPNPLSNTDFRQELRLQEGGVCISGGKTKINLWVDVFRPVVHVDVQSDQPVRLVARYESWRAADHLITGAREFRANSYKSLQKFPVKTWKDSVAFRGNDVLFYHRNRSDVENIFDYTVRMEGLDSVKKQMYNPIANNTFGGLMRGDNMVVAGTDTGSYGSVAYQAWTLQSKAAVRSQQLAVYLNVAQTSTLDEWKTGLLSLVTEAAMNQKTARIKSREWWKQYWNRSYIMIGGKDSAISRNYQLFRYQLGCNAYGKWPTKFNGGLFTFDPIFIDDKSPYSPDFRCWGGGTMTAQNQRLVYWPLLKSGDFDMLKPQFDFYLRALKNAELRTQFYWRHQGASFTEQIENFGLPNIAEYNLNRPKGYDPGMEYNAWLEYDWETVFEFAMMMLETERYEGRNIREYLPLIESCLTFYDQHYQMFAKQRGSKAFDEKGQYILYPGSACETYKMTYNSATTIATLKVILGRLLELPAAYLDSARRDQWKAMLQRIPPLPLQECEGHRTLAPAVVWARIQNSEAPQLYSVFPWSLYGVGKPDLGIAKNTYLYDPQVVKYRSAIGWRQYSIWAARLGMTSEAADLTRAKFKDCGLRFPTFWGPGFDWTPDHNWGGSAMIGLQEMLMQVDGKKIYLLPAWPGDWDAKFKLCAPYNTTVEAEVKDGKLINLKVTPAERAADVVVMNQ
jgi:hypothetical protein